MTSYKHLTKKYSENYGCYKFAYIVKLITGWKTYDLYTDGRVDSDGDYTLSSAHAFCVDSNGKIFDINGIQDKYEFVDKWISVPDECIGKNIDGRIWPEKLAYKIKKFNMKESVFESLYRKESEMLSDVREIRDILDSYYPDGFE